MSGKFDKNCKNSERIENIDNNRNLSREFHSVKELMNDLDNDDQISLSKKEDKK